MSAPEKSDMLDVFMRALVGADRIVVQTQNALGKYDAHYLHAPEILAAMNRRADLCDPTQDERVKALVEAAQAQLDYMDMCRERGDLERNLRAALRAMERGEG